MRTVLSLAIVLLCAWSATASAAGCNYRSDFDIESIRKTGMYFLIPKPPGFDVRRVNAEEEFDSLVTQRETSFTCQFFNISGEHEEHGLSSAGWNEWSCINTKTKVAWHPREFEYLTEFRELTKNHGNSSTAFSGAAVEALMQRASMQRGEPTKNHHYEGYLLLDNDGVGHWFSFEHNGVLNASNQRSPALTNGGVYLSASTSGHYMHLLHGNCSKSDQLVLYSVTELSLIRAPGGDESLKDRMPFILVSRESEGPYTPKVPIDTKPPAF